MDPHSFRVLEYPLILDALAGQSASVLGVERAHALTPCADPSLVRSRLQETREACALLLEGPLSDLSQARDIRASVVRAAIRGARLAPQDLTEVADTLDAGELVRRRLGSSSERPALAAIAARLRPPAGLAREIRRAVLPDGQIADSASPELYHLRVSARRARESARDTAQSLLADTRLAPAIAEPVVTLRNDRYVIPVLPGYRTLLSGIVQDQSATGHTLFLEPLALVEQNNAIRRLEREADAEVDRILGALTDQIRAGADDIMATVEALADCDLAIAKARLAVRWAAHEPRITEGGPLSLLHARHPVLLESRRQKAAGAEEVVPIDVPLADARVLVLTGPNAGGKTVALKTVGLLALMVQAGLQIPASPDSTVPVFRGVYADIGDEQSITQDLSTFSAHMARMTAILELADGQSLVLIDELGAGTDPIEGAALGGAILESLAGRGGWVLATTHLDGIKAFVAQDPRMANGAVEFDLDNMRPLYTLHMGFPGRSFAIEVACRLGVPLSIVHRARELRGDTSAGLAALLDRLHALEGARARDAAEAAQDRVEAQRLRSELEAKLQEAAARLRDIQTRAARLLAEIAGAGRKRIEAAVADLRQGGPARAAREAVAELPRLIDEALEDVASGIPAAAALGELDTVAEGQTVRVRNLGQVGTVLSPVNPQGLVEVQVPLGKVRVPLADLGPAHSQTPARGERLVTWTAGAGDALSPEIKVIGCTVEEAVAQVGRYLEDAVLGGLTSVRIVHGKGTGRLRKGLADFLKTHPLVSGFHLAEFNEGGAGATIVDLGSRPAAGPTE